MFIWYMLFGTAFYLLNLSRVEDEDASVIDDITGWWIFDSFQNMFELTLGEYRLEQFAEGDYAFIFYLVFIVAAFFIQIVFLNMLIAIMNDTFTRVTDERFFNSRLTKLEILADYADFIDRYDDETESSGDESENNENQN